MSVISSRVSNVSSILKTPGIRSQLVKQPNRVYFKLPKNLKDILYNFENQSGSKDYEDLICLLRDAKIKDSDLLDFLTDARQCIPSLGSVHKLFIDAILQIKWTTRPLEVITAYKVFIEDLICMQIYHIKNIVDNLVEQFKPVIFEYQFADNTENYIEVQADEAEWKAGKCKLEDLQRLSHIHDLLRKILKVVPLSSKLLLQSIRARFPYIVHNTHTHEVYVYALLQVLEYAPQLRTDILSLIISRLVVLDVNIPKSNTDESEDTDITEASECNEVPNYNDSSSNNEQDDIDKLHPIAHTLDVCMDQIFTYIHRICFIEGVPQMQQLKSLYFDVLKTFEAVILPTHASQYVQYIMFYICSFKMSVTEAFLDWLWRKACDPNVPSVTRQTSISYIASLISMAKFISTGTMKIFMTRISRWIHSYIALQECSEYVSDDIREHAVFYSICQALFFITIARHKDFVESKTNMMYLHELDLPKIITSKLNPLKACQPEIAHNFADVTRTYQLAYCYTIIENNMRSQLPVIHTGNTSNLWCDMFFPFNEYTLPRSGERLASLFYDKVKQNEKEQTMTDIYNCSNMDFE